WPHGDLAVTTDLDDDGWKLGDARVTVTATGVLGEIAAAETPRHSPLWRTIMAQPGLLAYWPLEDGEGAASGSSPVPGVSAAQIRSSVALGQGPVSAGSGPSAMISATVGIDRKSTRLNSSHVKTSYAVFCLKKKTQVAAH